MKVIRTLITRNETEENISFLFGTFGQLALFAQSLTNLTKRYGLPDTTLLDVFSKKTSGLVGIRLARDLCYIDTT